LCEFHLTGKKMSNLGIWIGFSFAGLCVFGIVYAALAMKTPADLSPRQLNLVILISGGLVGWVVGMLITPVSPKEQAVFSETGKALSTFVMGYLVAKIDRIFDVAMKKDENVNALFVGRLLMFVSMFALGVLATFVWRSYVHLG
jgi:xanthosine utilization system XapX-like protein